VILIGRGWNHDETNLKKDWDLSVGKLDSIVFKVFSFGKLAVQAGIIPAPNKALGEKLPNLDAMLGLFHIDMIGMWRHNGANDAVYQMTLAVLIIFFPVLYPDTKSGFPVDSSIAGHTINEIWADLVANKNSHGSSRQRLRTLLSLLRCSRRPRRHRRVAMFCERERRHHLPALH
jgi:hypothetical protein